MFLFKSALKILSALLKKNTSKQPQNTSILRSNFGGSPGRVPSKKIRKLEVSHGKKYDLYPLQIRFFLICAAPAPFLDQIQIRGTDQEISANQGYRSGLGTSTQQGYRSPVQKKGTNSHPGP